MSVHQPKNRYQLQVGVWDTASAEFVPVTLVNNTTTGYEDIVCDFSVYQGSVGRIAFRNVLSKGKSYDYNYLDDITLTLTVAKIAESSSANVIDEIGVERYLEGIVVYPNPTVGELHIGAVDVQKVECYNQRGQLVAVYDNENNINISSLAEGVYTLRITVPQGVAMRKVMKK